MFYDPLESGDFPLLILYEVYYFRQNQYAIGGGGVPPGHFYSELAALSRRNFAQLVMY